MYKGWTTCEMETDNHLAEESHIFRMLLRSSTEWKFLESRDMTCTQLSTSQIQPPDCSILLKLPNNDWVHRHPCSQFRLCGEGYKYNLKKLYPTAMSIVKLLLRINIFKRLVVRDDNELLREKVMAPVTHCLNHRIKLLIISRVS